MLGALEAKVHALEEQLDGEVRYVKRSIYRFELKWNFVFFREKQKISRSVRTLEKRLRDATGLADESRKQADAYKEQVKIRFHLFYFILFCFSFQRLKKQIHVYVIWNEEKKN